jgi:hypothetical protein
MSRSPRPAIRPIHLLPPKGRKYRSHKYGKGHKAARRRFQLRMKAGEVFFCWRPKCPTPDVPINPRYWDLGHVEGAEEVAKFGKYWPEHPGCNRATVTHLKEKLRELEGSDA